MPRTEHAPPPVRLGVVGCGNVLGAYRAAVDRLRVRGLAVPVAACGRESRRGAALAALGPVRFTTEPLEVATAPDVDLVLVLTSMPSHAALASAALAAGKHVLVEKPPATTLAEGRALAALAAASPGRLVCAPFTVLSPTFREMSRRLRRGEVGRPLSARARYGWAGPDWGDWFYREGGGCLFDLGVYGITSLTGLIGPVRRVAAFAGVAVPERPVHGRPVRVEAEDNAQVLLDFGAGTFGVVTTGFTLQQYRGPALEVYASEGTIQMLGDDWDPDGFEMFRNADGCWRVYRETAPDWSWTDGLDHLVECIRSGERPLATPEHAFHVLEILVRALESAREGRALAVESTFTPPVFADETPGEAAHRRHDRTRAADA